MFEGEVSRKSPNSETDLTRKGSIDTLKKYKNEFNMGEPTNLKFKGCVVNRNDTRGNHELVEDYLVQ